MTVATNPPQYKAEERAFLRVRAIRLEKGMTVQQIATAAGISYNTALAYERDNAIMIRKDVATKIADALGVKVADLFAS